MSYTVSPIGVVKNGITERPKSWKDVVSTIEINTTYQDGLLGLDEFSHIVVVFYLHFSQGYPMRLHPRGDPELPVVGLFSTRAPVRPNPIAVSVVKLLKITENVITVKGLDAFDSTPVLDIKPHLPVAEPEKLPEWV
ncbi:MAG: tRNA (N6-threonylcarbamoyladenosine(37)-N6)-methyltransferase TrmO [Candidatus Methanofastidiosia archaeon]|jgi:tRNA-Thr(GGU) m(6)t(6)A37 methyltransferase TsaA